MLMPKGRSLHFDSVYRQADCCFVMTEHLNIDET